MKTSEMKELLKERLHRLEWNMHFDKEKDTLRIEHKETGKGITLSLPGLVARWEEKQEEAIEQVVYYIEEAMGAMHADTKKVDAENIFPVIRATSFPRKNKHGDELVFDKHTAETRVYYAVNMDKTYRLIDKKFLEEMNISKDKLREIAITNVSALPLKEKKDEVAGNMYYFIRVNDGYDASRILDTSLLEHYRSIIEGDMIVAVPHQDVLIIADIRNDIGYDIIAQMTMKFFSNGLIPITSLSFIYENKELEPIFVMGKNRPKKG